MKTPSLINALAIRLTVSSSKAKVMLQTNPMFQQRIRSDKRRATSRRSDVRRHMAEFA